MTTKITEEEIEKQVSDIELHFWNDNGFTQEQAGFVGIGARFVLSKRDDRIEKLESILDDIKFHAERGVGSEIAADACARPSRTECIRVREVIEKKK